MSLAIKHFYRFGEFIIDSDQQVLLRDGKPLSLTLKVFETLLLVQNGGRIVSKAELMERLWPDTFVEEANLTFNIQQLRKALGDNARQPSYIETVARRGYRFIAEVEEVLSDDIALREKVRWRIEVSDSKVSSQEDRPQYQPIEQESPVREIAPQAEEQGNNGSPFADGLTSAPGAELSNSQHSKITTPVDAAAASSQAPAPSNEKGLTTPSTSSGAALPDRSRRYKTLAVSALALLLVGAIIFGFYTFYMKRTAPRPLERKSIAVLPVKPINASNRDEIYEIGVADSLILRLSSMEGFVARPLSATRKYVDVNQDPLAAGREQQVDYVLDSNYQLVGGKIRVTAHLFNVSNGQIEDTYKSEKDAGNIFAMQDAIADEVGKLLLARFATTFGSLAEKRGTTNEEAYRFYLQGMYFFDRRNGPKAVEAFEQAVRLDPNYARAWAGIAHAHRTVCNNVPSADVHEGYRKSIEAINRALELDNNLSEAYSALGDWKMYYEYDYAGAEQACKRAIELNPNSAVAHNVYARFLVRGRPNEAIAEIRSAVDLDPTSFYHQRVYMVCLTYAHRYDDAARQLETLGLMNPPAAVNDFWLVRGLDMQGNYAEVFERLMRCHTLAKTDEQTMQLFKTAYQTSGWQGVLREQAKYYEKNPNMPSYLASVYAGIGDKDKAFECLEREYEHRENMIIYLQTDPRFDPLRGDPRFDDLARRIRLR